MMIPPSKWQQKLIDMLTPAASVQESVDYLLSHNPDNLCVWIQDKVVFIVRNNEFSRMRIPPIPPKRFPLSKLRKDQLEKLYEIMKKQDC